MNNTTERSSSIRSRFVSFRPAISGLVAMVRSEPNARLHAVATVVVIVAAVAVNVSAVEAGLLVLAIGLVWIAEAVNTAIEAVVDLVSPERHPLAGLAKDLGAAAVLIAALTATGVGLCVFGPKLLSAFAR